MSELTHVNTKGEANMVDVSDKSNTTRIAKANACITMKDATLQKIKDNDFKKGDVLDERNLSVKRPGSGISPMKWDEVFGSIAIKNYAADDLIYLLDAANKEM